MSDLGLYIHVPFCARKCPYCDFNSFAGREGLIDAYIGAVLTELKGRSRSASRPTFTTLYVGGGTPTLLSSAQLCRLLEGAREAACLADGAEVTVEANPGTVDAAKLRALRRVGANRLSLGAQSFRQEDLLRLGRIHTVTEGETTFRDAREAGFDNVAIDLIYAIPEQSVADFRLSLERVVGLGPEHVSTYCLTMEDGTPLAAKVREGSVRAADEGLQLRMYRLARRLLRASGYDQYEISNFAVPGRECRHNLACWRGEPYVGIGAGAHSYMDGARSANVGDPAEYVRRISGSGDATEWRERLCPERALGEAVMLGLRTREGVRFASLRERFGIDVRRRRAREIRALREAGLLRVTPEAMALTARGLAVADEVALRFIEVSDRSVSALWGGH